MACNPRSQEVKTETSAFWNIGKGGSREREKGWERERGRRGRRRGDERKYVFFSAMKIEEFVEQIFLKHKGFGLGRSVSFLTQK